MSENSAAPVLSGDKTHSRFGCSAHPQLAACPGYIGGGGSSPAADKGNDLHDIAAEALEAALAGTPGMMVCIGDTLPCGQIFTQEDSNKVEAYIEQCLGLMRQYPQCDIILIEQEQMMSSLGLPNDVTTPDFMMVEPFGLCIVVDLKTGKGQVSPFSEQLRSYGLEAYENNACTSMMCCISQDGLLKSKQFTDMEIQLHKKHMTNMIAMAQWPNPPLCPGKACTYCARKCPARDGIMLESTGSLLTVNPEELSPEEVTRFLDFTEIIEAASKQLGLIKARGHAFREQGVIVKGWDLVDTRPTALWRSEEEAKQAILELFAKNTKREKIDPVPTKGAKTKVVNAPIPASELVVVTETMLSPNKVMEKVGKSAAVMQVLEPLIFKKPSGKKHLKRIKPALK